MGSSWGYRKKPAGLARVRVRVILWEGFRNLGRIRVRGMVQEAALELLLGRRNQSWN